jgi:DNA mismatch repair protein MutL
MPPSWTIPQSQQSIPIQLWQEGTTTEALPSNHWQYSNNCPDMHSASPDNSATTLLTPFGQIDGCYIVASGPEGLYIIDQHAAHERIIYDRLSQPRGQVVTQQLLIPPILDFDNREMRLIETHQPILAELGFLFDLAGPNTLRLMGLPLDVATEDVPDFMQDILALLQNHQTPTAATLRHGFIQIASCRGAIKAGCKLSFPEMKVLLAELFATAHPYTCPHGRPVIVHFGPDQLAKLFKRT